MSLECLRGSVKVYINKFTTIRSLIKILIINIRKLSECILMVYRGGGAWWKLFKNEKFEINYELPTWSKFSVTVKPVRNFKQPSSRAISTCRLPYFLFPVLSTINFSTFFSLKNRRWNDVLMSILHHSDTTINRSPWFLDALNAINACTLVYWIIVVS